MRHSRLKCRIIRKSMKFDISEADVQLSLMKILNRVVRHLGIDVQRKTDEVRRQLNELWKVRED